MTTDEKRLVSVSVRIEDSLADAIEAEALAIEASRDEKISRAEVVRILLRAGVELRRMRGSQDTE